MDFTSSCGCLPGAASRSAATGICWNLDRCDTDGRLVAHFLDVMPFGPLVLRSTLERSLRHGMSHRKGQLSTTSSSFRTGRALGGWCRLRRAHESLAAHRFLRDWFCVQPCGRRPKNVEVPAYDPPLIAPHRRRATHLGRRRRPCRQDRRRHSPTPVRRRTGAGVGEPGSTTIDRRLVRPFRSACRFFGAGRHTGFVAAPQRVAS